MVSTDFLEQEIANLKRLYELQNTAEQIIDANCNLLARTISFCEKNSIPFDNGLRVLLSEARKLLSPGLKRSSFSPEDETEP